MNAEVSQLSRRIIIIDRLIRLPRSLLHFLTLKSDIERVLGILVRSLQVFTNLCEGMRLCLEFMQLEEIEIEDKSLMVFISPAFRFSL